MTDAYLEFYRSRRVLITAVAFLSAVVALTGYLISRGQQKLIEFQALQLAEIVTRQSAASRSVYSEHVVGKLTRDGVGIASERYQQEPGHVPLPAQFLKLVGNIVTIDWNHYPLFSTQPSPSSLVPMDVEDSPAPIEPLLSLLLPMLKASNREER